MLALESINFFVFASTASSDVNLRIKFSKFLKSEGKEEFTLRIKVKKGYPDDLKEIKFDLGVYNSFFQTQYSEKDIAEIILSLSTFFNASISVYKYA